VEITTRTWTVELLPTAEADVADLLHDLRR
jgi:hypothetical protein